jgi:hypothetical protein
MAEVSRKETEEALLTLTTGDHLTYDQLCDLLAAIPSLAAKLSDAKLEEAIPCIFNEGIGPAMNATKRRGLVTQANALELFEGVTEYNAKAPTVEWFMRNFQFTPEELTHIVGSARDVEFDAAVAMAKLFPLNREGHKLLLGHLMTAADMELGPLNAKLPDFDLNQVVIDPRKYPLLYAYRREAFPRAAMINRGYPTAEDRRAFEESLEAKRQAELEKRASERRAKGKEPLRPIPIGGGLGFKEALERRADAEMAHKEKQAEMSERIARSGPPRRDILTDEELEKYEQVLRALGWFLNNYAKKYGMEALKRDYTDADQRGLDLLFPQENGIYSLIIAPTALVSAYRAVMRQR